MHRALVTIAALVLFMTAAYSEDIASLRVQAEQGQAEAQALLGAMYEDGDGVPPDYAEAAKWYRRAAGWPPYTHLAMLRAEAAKPGLALRFLAACRAALPASRGLVVLGPAPAPMEKRGGRWRAQLLLQSGAPPALHGALAELRALAQALPESRGIRWFVEVDPQDLF